MRNLATKNKGIYNSAIHMMFSQPVKSNYTKLFELANLNLHLLSASKQIEKLLK